MFRSTHTRVSTRFRLLVPAAAVALVVTACGSNTDPLATSSDAGAGAGGSTTAAEPTSGGGATDSDTSSGASGGAMSSAGSGSSSAAGGSGSSGSAGSGSGSAPAAGGTVIIGSADFAESAIIADVYAAALKAKGIEVQSKLRLGSREVYLGAMQDGSINLIPEYTGTLLNKFDAKATPVGSDQVYAALQKATPSNLTVLDKAPAESNDSLTVTKATADKWQLKTIEDLKPYAADMVLGGPKEFQTRPTGVPGLEKTYGLKFKKFEITDAGGPITIKALNTGIIQAGNVFTADPAISKNNLVVLEDTKKVFGSQNVVPLIAKSVATQQVTEALNAVSAELTTEDLMSLNDKVSNQHLDSAKVAADWVKEKGLG